MILRIEWTKEVLRSGDINAVQVVIQGMSLWISLKRELELWVGSNFFNRD